MLERAAHMAHLSSIAYLEDHHFVHALSNVGYDRHHWFDTNGTQAFVLPPDENNIIIICFRGTQLNELPDLLADLKVWRSTSDERGLVHTGFKEALDNVYPDILNLLDSMDLSLDSKPTIICTGHSLGGALATIMASRIDAQELYTFGSPRVGDRAFVKEMNKDGIKHYRFRNNNDIVTKVPLSLLFYRHHGTLKYINRKGIIKKLSIWHRALDMLLGHLSSWIKLKPLDSISDHSIYDYHRKITYNVHLSSKN